MSAPTDPVTPHKIAATYRTIRVTHEELSDGINLRGWLHTAMQAAEAERVRRSTMTPGQLAAYDAANLAKAETARAATLAALTAEWDALHTTHTHPTVGAVLDLHTPGDWGYCNGCESSGDAVLWESCRTIDAIRAATTNPGSQGGPA